MLKRTAWIAGGAFAVLTVALMARIVDFDLWWHLVVGRETVRAGHIPELDFYVYPALGTASGFHEWGFGVLAYELQRWTGWWGLSLANAAASAAALLLVAAAAVRRGASWASAVLLLGPLAIVSAYRFCYRPEAMLYLALGGTLYALERRALRVLPLLTFGLTLFHPSAVVLLVVIGCYAVDALLADRRKGLGVAVALAASAAAVLLAPGGWHALVLAATASGNEMNALIGEYVPVLRSEYRWHFVAVAAAAVAAVGTIRRRPSDVLLVVGFGYLALSFVRNLTLFALVALGPASVALERLLVRFPRLRLAAPASLLASAAVLVAAPTWGAGEAPGRYPAATADFILRHQPGGRIFNQLHTGGYLAWRLLPRYPVAIDGRNYYGVNAPLRYVDSVLEIQEGWRDQLDRWDVTLIATPGIRLGTGRLIPLVAELETDPRWELVVVEPAGVLFVRKDALPAGVTPLPKRLVWSQVLDATAGVGDARARFSRGVAFFRLHDFPRAAVEFAAYGAAHPEDREAAEIRDLLQASVRGDGNATRALETLYMRGRSL